MIDYGYGVTLGPLRKENIDSYRTWRNNPKIYNWCRQDDLLNEVGHEDWFYRQAKDPRIKMYEVLKGDKVVGVCGLTDFDMLHRRAEFSLYIAPDEQSNGYGKASIKTLFWWGFSNYGLNTIWGETFDGNPAAGVFERLGMKKDGSRTDFYWQGGRFIDAHLYSVRASEWQKLHPLS